MNSWCGTRCWSIHSCQAWRRGLHAWQPQHQYLGNDAMGCLVLRCHFSFVLTPTINIKVKLVLRFTFSNSSKIALILRTLAFIQYFSGWVPWWVGNLLTNNLTSYLEEALLSSTFNDHDRLLLYTDVCRHCPWSRRIFPPRMIPPDYSLLGQFTPDFAPSQFRDFRTFAP